MYIRSILSWEFRCSSSGFNLIQSLLQYLLFFPPCDFVPSEKHGDHVRNAPFSTPIRSDILKSWLVYMMYHCYLSLPKYFCGILWICHLTHLEEPWESKYDFVWGLDSDVDLTGIRRDLVGATCWGPILP